MSSEISSFPLLKHSPSLFHLLGQENTSANSLHELRRTNIKLISKSIVVGTNPNAADGMDPLLCCCTFDVERRANDRFRE